MPTAAEKLRAEVGTEPPKSVPAKRAKRQNGDFDLFGAANGIDTIGVLDFLGIPHQQTGNGKTMAKCPGCGEDGALLCENGGLKCMHDRCNGAGPRSHAGYRTNVDLVAHVKALEPKDAAKLLCEINSIPVPKGSGGGYVDDYQYDELDTYELGDSAQPTTAANTDPMATPPPAASGHQPAALRKLGDLLEPALTRAELRRSGDERPVPVPFPQYSEILAGGFWPGVHNMIAATGAGKSQFMFQTATHAAKAGVPVLYVGLELGEMQVALRSLSETSGLSWSRLYTGRCSTKDIERARQAIPALSELPFYVEFSSAHGWAPSNLITRAQQIRKAHPTGPMLVVLDFLQLVGAELGDAGRPPELRERIARAAYCGVHIANKYGASVVLVSSSARDKYALLAGDVKAAGFANRRIPGFIEPVRTILNPDALIGVGKESGEIEYAAESQTVLVRWPAPLDNGEKAVLVAVPKLRYGAPSWVAMSFWQRFQELPFRETSELPPVSGNSGNGREAVTNNEYELRILATIRRHPGLRSQNDVVKNAEGNGLKLRAAFKALLAAGRIASVSDGFVVQEGKTQ